jgi:hypothetical protein
MTADYAYKPARETAAKRHNVILRQHVLSPISHGYGLYLLCQCGAKGTWLQLEKHCQAVVLDVPVAR